MYLDLVEDPWALTEHGISLSDFSDKTVEHGVDGRKDLRVVCPSDISPWFRTRSNKLPPASFPFRSHGEVLRAYYLPTPCKEKQEGDCQTPDKCSRKRATKISGTLVVAEHYLVA